MKIENLSENIYTGEADEEIVNCEGGPCSFVIKSVLSEE